MSETTAGLHPAATTHLPVFITPPGQPDVLLNVMAVFLVLIVLAVGVFYLKLHALPEQIAHKGQKVQFQIVAILALVSSGVRASPHRVQSCCSAGTPRTH